MARKSLVAAILSFGDEMSDFSLPYDALLADALTSGSDVTEYLRREVPTMWLQSYVDRASRRTNVVVFTHGSFDYLYDDYATLESRGLVESDGVTEARLVGAIGLSCPARRPRDDSRLRGWVGATGNTFGSGWDKGHFIGHSIGGAVDGLEANVFVQRRAVNRGGYRRLERFCVRNPGVLCFSRPIYADPSARPSFVEFGVFAPSNEWWIELFDNR
jgi:hypothetical protein